MVVIDPVDEALLRWFVNADYAPKMGIRSGMGALLDGTGPSIPGTRTPSEQAFKASEKLRKFLARWGAVPHDQQGILREAFLRRECWVGKSPGEFDTKWKKFGSHPGALYALGEIRALAGATDNELNRFLACRLYDPDRPAESDGKKKKTRAEKRAGKKQTKAETKIVARHTAAMPVSLEVIREKGEHALVVALQAFGARVSYQGAVQPAKRLFNLSEIGRAMRMDHKTVAARCEEKGVVLRKIDHRSLSARLADLDMCWFEAGQGVRRFFSSAMVA